jgi:hypothetical protein
MDPISALSVAAAVIQFVDFGKHLLSASYEIYRSPSGETANEVDLSTIAKDLTTFVVQIKDKIGTTESCKRPRARPVAEYHLAKICAECEEIVTQFHGALNERDKQESTKSKGVGLRENPKTRLKMAQGAIRKALTSVWNSSKIYDTTKQLRELKDRLMTATLFCLW